MQNSLRVNHFLIRSLLIKVKKIYNLGMKKSILFLFVMIFSISLAFATNPNDFELARRNGGVEIRFYRGRDKNVEIPEQIRGETVIGIGSEAFDDNRSIQSLSLPRTIEYINPEAFEDCPNLKELTMYGLTEIKPGAFSDTAIRNINFLGESDYYCEDGVLYQRSGDDLILHSLLDSYENKTSFTVKKGVTVIGPKAFDVCERLKTVVLSDTVKVLSRYAFDGADSITKIDLARVEVIESYAFVDMDDLTSIVIPETVIEIQDDAFVDCEKLKKVEFRCKIDLDVSFIFRECPRLRDIIY